MKSKKYYIGVLIIAVLSYLIYLVISPNSQFSLSKINPLSQLAQVSSSGLLAHYTLDNTSGTDSSSAGNNAVVNGASQTSGVIGGALQFDGTDDYLIYSNNPGITAYPFSISAWVRTTASGGQIAGLYSSTSATAYKSIGIGSGGVVAVYLTNATVELGNTPINDGEWHHVTVAFGVGADNIHRLYIDGILDKQISRSTGLSINNICIGRACDSTPTGHFNGSIDDVRIYNRVLSLSDVEDLYALGGGELEIIEDPVITQPDSSQDEEVVVDEPDTTPLNTYYVATNGSNSNPGTASQPFLTLDKALTVAQPGATILLQSGTYSTSATTRRNATANNRITIRGVGVATNHTGQLNIDHDYYTVENMSLRIVRIGDGVPGGNNTIVRSNTIGGYFYPMRVWSDDNLITENTFRNLTPIGGGTTLLETVSGSNDNVISKNLFTENNGHDVIRPFGSGHVISENQFIDITSGPQAGHDDHADIVQVFGVSATAKAENIVFEKNIIRNSNAQLGNMTKGGTGTYYEDAPLRNWTFRNNIFINSRIQLNNYLPDVSFHNNTVFDGSSITGLRFVSSDTNGVAYRGRVFNNLFIRMGGNEAGGGVYSGCCGSFEAGNNIITDIDDSSKSSMTVDSTSINGGVTPDQLFVNWQAGDFRLKAGSPAIGAGKNLSSLGFSRDILGNSRGTTWDIGAYEYESEGSLGPAPVLDLSISNLSTSNITSTGATISWNTNVPADTQIFYDITTAYGSNTNRSSTLTTSHTQTLTNLKPNTTYYYKVVSRDSSLKTVEMIGSFATTQSTVINNGISWYVDKDAKGLNNGTSWSNAYTSFSAINWNLIKPGHTLYISGGTSSKTYTESWEIGSSGIKGNPVTIRVGQDAGHNGRVIFDYSDRGEQASGLAIKLTRSNVVIDGSVNGVSSFYIQNFANYLDRIKAIGISGNNVENVEIKYLTFQNINNGIKFTSSSYVDIHDNVMNGLRGDAAVYIASPISDWDVNRIYNNKIELLKNGAKPPENPTGSYGGPDGIQGGGSLSIYNNVFKTTKTSSVYTSTQHQDTLQVPGNYLKIFNNEFINVGDAAVQPASWGTNERRNNIWIFNNIFRIEEQVDQYPEYIRMYNNTGTIVSFDNLKIFNNLFIDNVSQYRPIRFSFGTDNNTTGIGNEIKNNIFYNVGYGSPHPVFHIDNTSGFNDNSWKFDNNVYYHPVSGRQYVSYRGNYSVADWIKNQEPNSSTQMKPLFVKYQQFASDNNFRLSSNDTVAMNKGQNLSSYCSTVPELCKDKDGKSRPQSGAWDIGAYEYGGTVSNPTQIPINGSCGATLDLCSTGTLNNITDSSTNYLWQCLGSGGGSSSQCSVSIPTSGDTTNPRSDTAVRTVTIPTPNTVTSSNTTPISTPTTTTVPTRISLTRNLTLGYTGTDVRSLQQFLNAKGFTVSTTGGGSPGNETTYFGPATRSALARYQASKGITPAVGFLGPITIASINSETVSISTPTTTTTTPTITTTSSFTRNLTLGSRGLDVLALQKFLNSKGFTVSTSGAGSLGNETTYFGPATRSALARYQASRNITPSVGFFGPLTRAKVVGE